jgi:hypothetical protein
MGTAFRPARTSPASWDAFSDVDAFVDAVLAELAAMVADGTRSTRSGRKPPSTGAALRRAIMAIWCVCFCGMQWRAIGLLCDIPFGTLYTLFARWTRLGLWRRLLNRLILSWRQACGDKPVPTAVIIDSRSCPSAPTCFTRGFDGGKKIKGIVPVLHQLAGRSFKGTALGDLSYRGERLSEAGKALGIAIEPSAGGHGGTFIPEGIRWVVERSLAWVSRYRRLNTIFERTEGHLVAFIESAFISILSRRLVRLATQEISV